MSKTNSNSMTSLLVAALNDVDSEFRNALIQWFKEKTGADIPAKTVFYDGTHQTLLYREMNGKEIDIIAREPGKRKPVLMIEVKAGLWENLQDSQCKGGEYQKTAEKYEIPLIYIIPRYYSHESDIPKNAEKIEWESILGIARKHDKYLVKQIENFVEISEDEKTLSEGERNLLTKQGLLKEVHCTKQDVLDEIYNLLKKRKDVSSQENQYGVGWYYKYGKSSLFIGFNPWQNEDRFFSLCIQEDVSTDKDDKLYYDDGWYYVPVQDLNCVEGDEKVLTELRKVLKEKNIVISKSFAKSLRSFYTLKAKIANLAADYAESKVGNNYYAYEDGDDKGFCFGGNGSSEYFLGLSFEHSIFSLDIHQSLVDENKSKILQGSKNGDYYAFPLNKYTEQFNDFVNSSSGEELQKNFNALVDAAKKEADSYRKA